MIENNNPDIDVEEIMVKIRAEIEGRKEKGTLGTPVKKPRERQEAMSLGWPQFQSILKAAETNADIMHPELPMARYPRSVRWLARKSGRIILYLARFVTARQTNFNYLTLQALNGLEPVFNGLFEEIRDLKRILREHGESIAALRQELSQERKQAAAVLETSTSELRADIGLVERRVGNLLEEARKRLPAQHADRQLSKAFEKAEAQQLDRFYMHFTDRFRGSREDIKERLRVYLPIIQENHLGSTEAPILDLGCGRGEWLEILKDANLSAQGIDSNAFLVESCQQQGLTAHESDVFDYLRSAPDQSIGAITAFHLIEHLACEDMIKLLDEMLRVLKSGGIAILETPNPENVLVGSCNFYYDPTHRNPIPPLLLKFMLQSRGFYGVTTKLLHEYDEASRIEDGSAKVVQRFNDYFYGPQDYAVYGFKV